MTRDASRNMFSARACADEDNQQTRETHRNEEVEDDGTGRINEFNLKEYLEKQQFESRHQATTEVSYALSQLCCNRVMVDQQSSNNVKVTYRCVTVMDRNYTIKTKSSAYKVQSGYKGRTDPQYGYHNFEKQNNEKEYEFCQRRMKEVEDAVESAGCCPFKLVIRKTQVQIPFQLLVYDRVQGAS